MVAADRAAPVVVAALTVAVVGIAADLPAVADIAARVAIGLLAVAAAAKTQIK